MTISPLADETARDDADLARAAAGGDRVAFAAIYDRYTDRLYDFCVGMLRDRDAAADCVQDVFLTAATRLAQLREPDRLRSWLYAIARNEALNRIRQRRREDLSEEPPEMASDTPDLDVLAARSELAALINDACGGLSDRDRTVFELAYRHGLDGPELADALGVSHTNANTLLGRLRDTVERSLGALLVSRRAAAVPNTCSELVALLGEWDGRFTVLMRKRVARHIDNCPTCDDERRRMVNPVALLGSAPVFVSAPAWLRQHTLAQFPSAVAPAAVQAAPAGAHAGVAQQSWWPPQSFTTSDLAGPTGGPACALHPGAGAPKFGDPAPPFRADQQLGPPLKQFGEPAKVEALKIRPQPVAGPNALSGGPQTMHTDSGHGHLGGRARTALLVALVLVALGTVAVLGTVLVRQMWPPAGPAQTPTPAGATMPVATTTPPGPAPTSLPIPQESTPAPPQIRPSSPTQATSDFTPVRTTPVSSPPPAPPAPAVANPTEIPVPQLPPPAPVPLPAPNFGAGALPGAGSSGSSGGSPNPPPVSSGGSSGGGSPPVSSHKVFGGSGSTLNDCPALTGCPSVPNNHGIK